MKNKEQQSKDKKNALEWSVFGISLLMVLLVLGYLVYHAFENRELPPMLEVVYSPDPTPYSPYRYQVTTYNKGGSTAEQVLVKVIMKDNGSILEEASLIFSWIPQTSKRVGWVIFSQNPARADSLTAQVVSYQVP